MKMYLFIILCLLAVLAATGLQAEEQAKQIQGFAFVDADNDGVNDNLVAPAQELAGQTQNMSTSPSEGGERPEARFRYKHGFHGKELERDRLAHQHKGQGTD